jgi:hypothetical protein
MVLPVDSAPHCERDNVAENCGVEITLEMIESVVSGLSVSPWVVERTPHWALRELAQELLEGALIPVRVEVES